MYNMDKAAELHKNIRQMMGELKHEYDCLYDYLMSKPDADEAYKKGLNEAWEAARKLFEYCHADINNAIFDGKAHCGMSADRMARDALNTLSPAEVIAKIRDYEARQKAEDEAVKVGDEVECVTSPKIKIIVTWISSSGDFSGIRAIDGYTYSGCLPERWRKTGRNFPEIAVVLGQMKGD